MKNSVCYFTTEWSIKMVDGKFDDAANYFSKEFISKVYDDYEKLRWSKGLTGGGQAEIDKLYQEIFSKPNIEAFENIVYCDLLLKMNTEKFIHIPSSGKTLLTKEIIPELVPSQHYPFGDWQLNLKYSSKEYTILNTDFTDSRGSTYYNAISGNSFAVGIDTNKNEVLRLMVSRRVKMHIVASKEL
jgi:hypothetical protein